MTRKWFKKWGRVLAKYVLIPSLGILIYTVLGSMKWMSWTVQGAVFFSVIVSILIMMGFWEVYSPTVARRGFLPMPTTRGDRLFIGLMSCAWINLAWLGLTDLSQWPGFAISLVCMMILGRWG